MKRKNREEEKKKKNEGDKKSTRTEKDIKLIGKQLREKYLPIKIVLT
jgi:NACalpha-BTF3-like transcription factor